VQQQTTEMSDLRSLGKPEHGNNFVRKVT